MFSNVMDDGMELDFFNTMFESSCESKGEEERPRKLPAIFFEPAENEHRNFFRDKKTSFRKPAPKLFFDEDDDEADSNSTKCFRPLNKEEEFVKSLPITLGSFQLDAIRWMAEIEENEDLGSTGALLSDPMGSGKTVDCLGLIQYFHFREIRQQTLVVAPLCLMLQWKQECLDRFGIPEQDILLYHGPHRDKMWKKSFSHTMLSSNGQILQCSPRIIITNYETVVKEHKKSKTPEDKIHLFDTAWDRIFFDEAHVLRNKKKNCFQACKQLQGRAIFCVTGTPIINRLDDIHSLSLICTPSTPLNLNSSHHCEQWKMKYLLKRKRDIIVLPPLEIKEIWLELEASEKQLYRDSEREFLQTSNSRQDNNPETILPLLSKLRGICNHSLTLALPEWIRNHQWQAEEWFEKNYSLMSAIPSSSKTKEIVRIVTESMKDKLVIFSQFTNMLDLIKVILFYQLGIRCLSFDGRISKQQQRFDILEEYRKNDDIKILLISLNAGGVGLNLTVANKMIFVDPWWNNGVERQAFLRIHRIGQTKPVTIYRLITVNSIETDMLALQANKTEEENDFYNEDIDKNPSFTLSSKSLELLRCAFEKRI